MNLVEPYSTATLWRDFLDALLPSYDTEALLAAEASLGIELPQNNVPPSGDYASTLTPMPTRVSAAPYPPPGACSIGHSLWAVPPIIQPISSWESQGSAVWPSCTWPA